MIAQGSWLADALFASALLMIAVLALRGPVARLFGAKVAYAMWAIPLLRMLLPALPDDWVFAGSAVEFTPSTPLAASSVDAAIAMRVSTDAVMPTVDWVQMAFLVWMTGAVLHLLWQIGNYRVFLRRALVDSTVLTRAAGIEVRHCPGVESPMAVGLIRRRVLLPTDFGQRFSPEERRLALAHEIAHHCRGDLIANFAGLAMLSVHWFNPFAYWAHRAFRDDQETACDATVLGGETTDQRHSYGSAILKSVSCRIPGAACALNHAGALKRRIMIMVDGEKSASRRVTGAVLAATLLAGGLIGTASTFAAVESDTKVVTIDRQGSTMTVTHNGQTRPATPAERREAEAADREAQRAERRARQDARMAAVDARIATQTIERPEPPQPIAPVAPIEPIAAIAPPAPIAPMAVVVRPYVNRDQIRAQVAAAMVEARAEIARARAEGYRARDAAHAQAYVTRQQALAEASVERQQALAEAAVERQQALAEAMQARQQARAEADRARREARRFR